MAVAGDPAPSLRPDESLKPMKEVKFPKLDKLNHLIPTSKITNTHGPAQISSNTLSTFWEEIKSKLNPILQKPLSYPLYKQGYYQRTIPKTSDVKTFKDLRPLGILNPIPKYILNKTYFLKIRDHILPILNKRNNFSFRGTHLCITS